MCCGYIKKDYIERHWFGRYSIGFHQNLSSFDPPCPYVVLTELFNYILTSSTFSLVWKISSVVPIPKDHSPTEKSDYRLISILTVLAKAFEKVMYEQVVNYVSR
jgi:hypothetical protein